MGPQRRDWAFEEAIFVRLRIAHGASGEKPMAGHSVSRARRSTGIVIVLAGLGPVLAGCASDMGAANSGPSKLGGPALVPAKAQSLADPEPLRRGALSDRVLAASALERVTGRQPDAGRLVPSR
jgi:hypothetical protein